MPPRSQWLGVVLAAVLSVALAAADDTLQELRDKLARERDADDRAKITVHIGEMLLGQIAEALKESDLEAGKGLLDEYVEAMRQAYEDLSESGRDARRKPKGFKDLEIHLRRSHKTLEELGHLLSFDELEPLQKAMEEIDAIREKLLDNLMSRDEEAS